MIITQKSVYALRALFDLAKRDQQKPVKIGVIAESQEIPPRFLEVILNRLKQAGIVDSRRGSNGGYSLAQSPETITVGDIIRIIQGPLDPVPFMTNGSKEICTLDSDCAFLPLWQKTRDVVNKIYDNTSIHDLVEKDKENNEKNAIHYVI